MPNRLIRYELGAGIGRTLDNNSGTLVVGDTTPTTTSTAMYGAACDLSGNIYVTDSTKSSIYKIDQTGNVYLFAGAGAAGTTDTTDGDGATARFNAPRGIAVDRSGNIYVADTGNARIRKITSDGYVTTLLKTGLVTPHGIACAPNGDIFVADTGTHRVQRIRPHGLREVYAGSSSGDTYGATIFGEAAQFASPTGVAVAPNGDVLVCDDGNKKIKRIALDGGVHLYCGSGSTGNVNGVSLSTQFTSLGFAVCDKSGDLFVVDLTTDEHNRIKKIDRNGNSSTVAFIFDFGTLGLAVSPNDTLYVIQTGGSAAVIEASSSSSSSSSKSSGSSQSSPSSSNSSESSSS